VFPAQTLGKHYVVTTPTGPAANAVGQVVRFVGNADYTTLAYKPYRPNGCPAVLNAGEVMECLAPIDFEVTANEGVGIATFKLGSEIIDPNFNPNVAGTKPLGDPSESLAVAVEQYRKRYVFLAPNDYVKNFVDIVASPGTTITLDGKDVSQHLKSIQGTTYDVARINLGAGTGGVHTLEATAAVGIQVLGYGENTSYQYPGGLNLKQITAVPLK